MADDHTALAIVGILGIVGLIGLFIFMSRSQQAPAQGGVMIIEPTQKGGWVLIRATSLSEAGFTQVGGQGGAG